MAIIYNENIFKHLVYKLLAFQKGKSFFLNASDLHATLRNGNALHPLLDHWKYDGRPFLHGNPPLNS